MDGYKGLNKQEILRRWYEYVDMRELGDGYTEDGVIYLVPDKEMKKSYCKLLVELHREIAPYRDELMRDFEVNPDDEFLQKCVNGIFKDYPEMKAHLDTFHLEDSEASSHVGTLNPIQRVKKDNPTLWSNGAWLFGSEKKMSDYLESFKGSTTPFIAAEKYLDLQNVNGLGERNTIKILYDLLHEAGVIKCTPNNFYKQLNKARGL